MKPLKRYFHKVLFISYVVLTFESVDGVTIHMETIQLCYRTAETGIILEFSIF